MRAIVIEKFGGIDGLVYKDIPKPEPKSGHVVIHSLFAALKELGVERCELEGLIHVKPSIAIQQLVDRRIRTASTRLSVQCKFGRGNRGRSLQCGGYDGKCWRSQ